MSRLWHVNIKILIFSKSYHVTFFHLVLFSLNWDVRRASYPQYTGGKALSDGSEPNGSCGAHHQYQKYSVSCCGQREGLDRSLLPGSELNLGSCRQKPSLQKGRWAVAPFTFLLGHFRCVWVGENIFRGPHMTSLIVLGDILTCNVKVTSSGLANQSWVTCLLIFDP